MWHKYWIKWFIVTVKPHFKLYLLQWHWHILEHKSYYFTHAKSLFCRNHSVVPYFVIFIFFQLSCSLTDCCSIVSWLDTVIFEVDTEMLLSSAGFPHFQRNIAAASTLIIVSIFSCIYSSICSVAVHTIAMWITCSITNYSTGQKLYTCAVWSDYKMHMNLRHTILQKLLHSYSVLG
jgi:hypothetical protein